MEISTLRSLSRSNPPHSDSFLSRKVCYCLENVMWSEEGGAECYQINRAQEL